MRQLLVSMSDRIAQLEGRVKQLERERVAGNEEDKDEPSVGNATMQNIHRSVATAGESTSTSSAQGIKRRCVGYHEHQEVSTDTEPDRIESGQGESHDWTQRRKAKKKRKEQAWKDGKRSEWQAHIWENGRH
jgi:hypothetical protein